MLSMVVQLIAQVSTIRTCCRSWRPFWESWGRLRDCRRAPRPTSGSLCNQSHTNWSHAVCAIDCTGIRWW